MHNTSEIFGLEYCGTGAPSKRLAFTGRMKAGKDYIAAQCGAEVIGLGEPFHRLLDFYFGVRNKDACGARKFMQTVGQWGRGVISEEYPVSPERAVFCDNLRVAGSAGVFVDDPVLATVEWEGFGRNTDIWTEAVITRAKQVPPDQRVVITGVRFEEELSALRAAGWEVWHVIASPHTIRRRMERAGLKESDADVALDPSERLALALDSEVLRRPLGLDLRCVWSDERVWKPSNRILSVDDFVLRLMP